MEPRQFLVSDFPSTSGVKFEVISSSGLSRLGNANPLMITQTLVRVVAYSIILLYLAYSIFIS